MAAVRQVPAYEEDGLQLFESARSCSTSPRASEALLPATPQPRARATEWMFAALNSIEPPIQNLAAIDLFYADQDWAKLRRPAPRRWSGSASPSSPPRSATGLARRRPLHRRRPHDGDGAADPAPYRSRRREPASPPIWRAAKRGPHSSGPGRRRWRCSRRASRSLGRQLPPSRIPAAVAAALRRHRRPSCRTRRCRRKSPPPLLNRRCAGLSMSSECCRGPAPGRRRRPTSPSRRRRSTRPAIGDAGEPATRATMPAVWIRRHGSLHRHALRQVARLVDVRALAPPRHDRRAAAPAPHRPAARSAGGPWASRSSRWRSRRPAAMPSASEISTTLPPRAWTSCMFETVFSNSGPDGARTIIGTLSSISAIGPCFISPAA